MFKALVHLCFVKKDGNLLNFLIDNIFVMFCGHVFNRLSNFPITKLFVWSWPHTEPSAEKREKIAQYVGFKFRKINDVLSLNIFKFGDYVDRIYPIELKIKDTNEPERSASFHDLYLKTKLTVRAD